MSKDGKVHIQGHFALQPNSPISLKSAVSVRYEKHDPTSLDVEILFLGDEIERTEAYTAARAIDVNLMKLHPINKGEESINLLGITGWQSSLTTMSLDVGAIEVGIDREPANRPIEVRFTVGLQPSGILLGYGSVELHYNGDITTKRGEAGAILVETSLGPIEAMAAYEYLDGRAFGDKVVHRVQRARLCGMVELQAGETLRSLHDRLQEEVFTICAALSLCYRQPVDAYEIEYLLQASENDRFERAVYRRKWHKSRARHNENELIHSSNLRDGGLSKLAQALKMHPESKSLDRGIGFLSHSYVSFLETGYFMAFSAMETIVNAVSKDLQRAPISSSAWKKIQKSLRTMFAEFAEQGLIPAETARHMRDKLPEIRRLSLASRIDMVVNLYSIKTSDLWTAEGFVEGMKRASEFRNGLFHAAHTSDLGLMSVDLTRIRTFTERLLLSALSWPEERRWVWRDESLHRIIQPPDPNIGSERTS
ncbi:hypothetical protein [Luteimonas granuli]|uniref:ApeA N-terminal domain-containing protein n=1 Tax=Luteimonas granuli TaxID=1176533 RepID=A0A518N166_9GAMM|nr:hypothetical protein [Luteimonas granuli]QDW65652.1 hypothetical protein FPZ22_01005 [Luteimonas granuli]